MSHTLTLSVSLHFQKTLLFFQYAYICTQSYIKCNVCIQIKNCIKIIRTGWNFKIWSVSQIIWKWVDIPSNHAIPFIIQNSYIFIDSENKPLIICFTIHENNCLKMMDTSATVFVMYVFSRLNGACNWMAHESINAFPCIHTKKTCIEMRCFIYILALKKILFLQTSLFPLKV